MIYVWPANSDELCPKGSHDKAYGKFLFVSNAVAHRTNRPLLLAVYCTLENILKDVPFSRSKIDSRMRNLLQD